MKTIYLLLISLLFSAVGHAQSGFCSILEKAINGGKNGFATFRGPKEGDTLHYKVKESTFKNSTRLRSGSITLGKATPKQKFRVNTMVFNATPFDSLTTTYIPQKTVDAFTLYCNDLHGMCFEGYSMSDMIRGDGDLPLYYIYKGKLPLTAMGVDNSKAIGQPYLILRVKKTEDGKQVYIEMVFVSVVE